MAGTAVVAALGLLAGVASCSSGEGRRRDFCGTTVAEPMDLIGVSPWFVDGTAQDDATAALPLEPDAGTWVRVSASCSDDPRLSLSGTSARIEDRETADEEPGGNVVAVRLEATALGTSVLSITAGGRTTRVTVTVVPPPRSPP